jgi:8-oxo-dGTP diphosphatase
MTTHDRAAPTPEASAPRECLCCGGKVCGVGAAPAREASSAPGDVHGVTFLLIHDGCVLLERCPKKAVVLGVGEWFVPGGKLEPGEAAIDALNREMGEELGVTPTGALPLPLLEGSAVPPGPRGLFLMRPYLVTSYAGTLPSATVDEGVPLRWVPIAEALASPVPQVRMMVAAAIAPATVAALTAERERAHRVHLARHIRLAEAMGMDPGYSADATINAACALLTRLRAGADCVRVRGELRAAAEFDGGPQP